MTPPGEDQTVSRKGDHVDIILSQDVQARVNAWDDVVLLHEALPEVDRDQIDTSTELLNRRLAAPVMVASMTGGYDGAETINDRLAEAAAHHGIGMGVGSQRAMLTDPSQASTYEVINKHDVPFVAANIGAPQLIPQGDEPALEVDQIQHLIEAIDADALVVHLNYLQEIVQPEGDTEAAGVIQAIERLVTDVDLPVIAKETGAGMTRRTAMALAEAGCAAIDVGGLSGTTFAAVERERAEQAGSQRHVDLGDLYRDWGVPTPVATVEAAGTGEAVIATGGIRHGLDVARAIALGATCAGTASAVLRPANQGPEELDAFLTGLVDQLATAMFLTGCETTDELAQAPLTVRGASRTWLQDLGYDLTDLAAQRLR